MIGFRMHSTNTFNDWVWGEEIMVRGIIRALEARGLESWIGNRHDECPDGIRVVMLLAPYTDGVPLTPGKINVLWIQFPKSLRDGNPLPITEFQRKYDALFFASKRMRELSGSPANSEVMYVCADPTVYYPIPTDQTTRGVVFVGNYHSNLRSLSRLTEFLHPALEFGLEIYGNGWGESDYCYRRAWHGPLHPSQVNSIYNSSRAVLSIHGDSHVAAEMPNTRIAEAALSGACVVSDTFPEIINIFGSSVLWAYRSQDVRKHIKNVLAYEAMAKEKGNQALSMAESVFSCDVVAKRLERLLRQLGAS